MTRVADGSALWVALLDAVSLASEMDGAPVHEKLARFGLDADDVRDVLQERWETYRGTLDLPDDPEVIVRVMVMFVKAMIEGLLTGMLLKEPVDE